tara:strand:- start:350 stop:784 length:435 start_codon:yes stop_codon:yes gene_type:complete
MTARADIKNGLVTKIKEINGTAPYTSNLYGNVLGRLKYWDEVSDYPFVCITAGREDRQYLPGNFKWGILNIPIWIYIKSSNSEEALDNVMSDIELLVDTNQELEYATGKFTEDISILNLSSDEGLMEPLRIGEILLQVRYGIDG